MSDHRALVRPPANPEADPGEPRAVRGVGRLVRRFFRFLGILLAIAMFGFLTSQHLLPPFLPSPGGVAQAAGPSLPTSDGDKKLAVCFGYADLEDGVISLNPSQPGRVAEVLVQENDEVAAGAPLLRLDDREARLRVEEARALQDEAAVGLAKAEKGPAMHRLKVEEQRTAVNMARYRLSSAQHTLASRQERMRGESIGRLRDDPSTVEGVASTAERIKEFEEVVRSEEKRLASLELQDPLLDLQRARAEVTTTRSRLQLAERVLEEHTLRAPDAGKVLRILVTPGEYLGAAKSMSIQFCPDRPRIIRAEVDQAFALPVEVGLSALVEDDCSSGNTWQGKVKRISDWYTERRQIASEHLQFKDVRTLECVVSLDPGQRPLRIGQRVRVTISRRGP